MDHSHEELRCSSDNRDGDRHSRECVHEIVGTINRIDDPCDAVAGRRRGILAFSRVRLLTEETVGGVSTANATVNDALTFFVCKDGERVSVQGIQIRHGY
jgi:hypothetical protein